jgi:hypothetical protein
MRWRLVMKAANGVSRASVFADCWFYAVMAQIAEEAGDLAVADLCGGCHRGKESRLFLSARVAELRVLRLEDRVVHRFEYDHADLPLQPGEPWQLKYSFSVPVLTDTETD